MYVYEFVAHTYASSPEIQFDALPKRRMIKLTAYFKPVCSEFEYASYKQIVSAYTNVLAYVSRFALDARRLL